MTPEEAAQAEAERRYPKTARMRFAFESGAAFEREQLRELLEAAREYREALMVNMLGPQAGNRRGEAANRLLAAAAALEEA